MAKNPGPITKWSQYLGARLAAAAVLSFEVDTNLRTAAAVGRLMHRFDKRHRERGLKHLAMAYPDLPRDEIESINRRTFEHFIQLVVEMLHTPQLINEDNWHRCVSFGNFAGGLNLLNPGKPVIMLTGHVGNWEMLGTLMAVLGFKMNAIARPIDNPLINDWLLGIRERRGLTIITKWNATDRMIDVLDSGGALGFIADQNAGDKGMFVPFFGRLASTYKSIGLLAIQKETPILCGCCHRLDDRFHYQLSVTDIIYPHEWVDRHDPLYYVTARYMRAIEMMVRRNPAQYLWMHRRWKSRPRHEREGKAMPRGLQRNLEDLPWMTDELIANVRLPVEGS